MAVPQFGFSISPGEAQGVAGECREAELLTTILRGKVMVEDDQLLGSGADGRFVKRKMVPGMLSRPGVYGCISALYCSSNVID